MKYVGNTLFGVITPILCLVTDTFLFKGGLNGPTGGVCGDARVFVYLVIGFGVVLFVCQKLVKPLAHYTWLWAPCFIIAGTVALVITILLIPIAGIGFLLATDGIIISLGSHTYQGTLQMLLDNTYYLFTCVLGLTAWVSALVFLRNGARNISDSLISLRHILAVLAFGLAVFGTSALVNSAAQNFIDKRVDVILTGSNEDAVASAYSLKAAFWCDWSCLHRMASTYYYDKSLTDERRELVANCFNIVTDDDIKKHYQHGI